MSTDRQKSLIYSRRFPVELESIRDKSAILIKKLAVTQHQEFGKNSSKQTRVVISSQKIKRVKRVVLIKMRPRVASRATYSSVFTRQVKLKQINVRHVRPGLDSELLHNSTISSIRELSPSLLECPNWEDFEQSTRDGMENVFNQEESCTKSSSINDTINSLRDAFENTHNKSEEETVKESVDTE